MHSQPLRPYSDSAIEQEIQAQGNTEPPVPEGMFLQPKITGYRQLSEHEVALMNEGKALAELCGAFIEKLRASAPGEPSYQLLDQRWISIGATDLQRGFMAIIRGIAQPTTF